MNKVFTSALLLGSIISATCLSAQHRIALPGLRESYVSKFRTAPQKQQPATAARGTAVQQRLIGVFASYGSGDDSVVYNYGNSRRGSMPYDIEAGGDYDGGFKYLNDPFGSALFDSTNYLTRTDHSSAFGPYLRDFAWYNSANSLVRAEQHLPDSTGTYQNNWRQDLTRNAAGDVIRDQMLKWIIAGNRYDSLSLRLKGYTTAAKPDSESNYYYPTQTIRKGNYKIRNYYNTSGDAYLSETYSWDTTTNAWKILPDNRTTTAFTPNHDPLTVTTELQVAGVWGNDSRLVNTYSPTNQLLHSRSDLYGTSSWDSSYSHHYTYTPGVSFYTKDDISVDDGAGNWLTNAAHVYRTLNAQNLIATQNLYDVSIPGDTLTIVANYTWNSYGNPVTRTLIGLDAYGNPAPDTFTNLSDRYYYELYNNGVGIAQTPAKNAALKLYPNPATGQLHLTCNDFNTGTVSITDITGRIIRQHAASFGTDEVVLPVGDFTPGVYVVSVADGSGAWKASKSFVKQ